MPQNVSNPKKMEKHCAWPMVYLEHINSNDGDDGLKPNMFNL